MASYSEIATLIDAITAAEAARRLNLKHQTESRGLRKLWQWLVD